MYYIRLYHIRLYHIISYYIILYYVVSYIVSYIVLYHIMLYYIILYEIIWQDLERTLWTWLKSNVFTSIRLSVQESCDQACRLFQCRKRRWELPGIGQCTRSWFSWEKWISVGQPERWCKTSSPSFRLPAVFSVHGMSILMSSKHGRFVGLSPKDTAAHSPAMPGVSFAIHSGEVPRCATMCHDVPPVLSEIFSSTDFNCNRTDRRSDSK